MHRGTALLGLGLIAALVAMGIVAMGAVATPHHLFRCVAYPLGNYKDPECREPVLDGSYKRIAFTEGEPAPLTGVQTSDFVLSTTTGGGTLTTTCKSAATSGTMENPEGGGAGTFAEVETEFGECTVAPAILNCQIPGKSISTTSMSGAVTSGPSITLEPESGELVAEIPFEKCALPELNKTHQLTGTAVGAMNNETSEVEFTTTSGSSLALDGAPTTLTGSSELSSEEDAVFAE
jgi:hypothetical protein